MRQTDEIALRVERIAKAMSTLQIDFQRQKVLLDEMATGLSAEANKIRASIDSLDAKLMPLWAAVAKIDREWAQHQKTGAEVERYRRHTNELPHP